MFGAVVMLGTSYTLKKNEHVRVDIVYANVSTGFKAGGFFFGNSFTGVSFEPEEVTA